MSTSIHRTLDRDRRRHVIGWACKLPHAPQLNNISDHHNSSGQARDHLHAAPCAISCLSTGIRVEKTSHAKVHFYMGTTLRAPSAAMKTLLLRVCSCNIHIMRPYCGCAYIRSRRTSTRQLWPHRIRSGAGGYVGVFFDMQGSRTYRGLIEMPRHSSFANSSSIRLAGAWWKQLVDQSSVVIFAQ